jgi:6-pyruvoyltetrahydropterin/6-carboxytetrahydropterin synthase
VLPVTCEVGLSRSVRAFHIMPGLPGPEGQLHDHDYRIEVVVDREQLDDRGMVCDLDVLEAALTELTSRVEGRNLEEIRPAGAEAVTVEVFARWGCRGRRGAGRAGVGNSDRVRRIPRTMLRPRRAAEPFG